MFEIKCSAEGCNTTIKSDVPLAPGGRYLCVLHTKKAPELPDRPRFQSFQFDPGIPYSKDN